MAVVEVHAGDSDPLNDLCSCGTSPIDKGGIEIDARGHGGVEAIGWQGNAEFVPRRGSQPCPVDIHPIRHGVWIASQSFKFSQCQRREAIATALVARKDSLVNHDAVHTGAAGVDGGRGACRSGSDDEQSRLPARWRSVGGRGLAAGIEVVGFSGVGGGNHDVESTALGVEMVDGARWLCPVWCHRARVTYDDARTG